MNKKEVLTYPWVVFMNSYKNLIKKPTYFPIFRATFPICLLLNFQNQSSRSQEIRLTTKTAFIFYWIIYRLHA